MTTLSKIIDKYAAFEFEVRAYTAKIFRHHCSACKGACCKPEYCAETLTNPFLSRLRRRFASDAVYSDSRGWLTPTGCALPVGRPPVCYQFFCRTIQDAQPTAPSRYAIVILSNLVAHAGKKVCGHKHIVELEDVLQLKCVNLSRFEKQLNEAENAFMLVRAYLEGQITDLSPSPALMKISTAPAGLFPKRFHQAPGRCQLNPASRHRQNHPFRRI
ncbi:MAG: hypothetical protein P8X68_19145 [Desulfobacterales bacterium]|jgi:hypothetical protein